jgi:hypothetical protein
MYRTQYHNDGYGEKPWVWNVRMPQGPHESLDLRIGRAGTREAARAAAEKWIRDYHAQVDAIVGDFDPRWVA